MKKIILLPLLLLPLMTSCAGDQKVSLRFGTKITVNSVNELKELTSQELLTKTRDEKEIFLLAVYQDRYSEECACWTTFKNTITNYINEYNDMVYLFNSYNLNESLLALGIEKLETSTPYLYIFNGQKSLAKYVHSNNKDRAIFEDTTGEAMYKNVRKVINGPKMFYVDDEYLWGHRSQEQIVMFIRNGCSDCKYTISEVLIPYIAKHKLNKDILVFDMQSYYDESKNMVIPDESCEPYDPYQDIKDRYGLSVNGDSVNGYRSGVVPTIQYRKEAKVQAAAIYFNDYVGRNDDLSFYISDSFYSSERQGDGKTKYAFPNVLKGMKVTEGVLENNGNYYWSQSAANKYHKPNFEAFLNFYVL